MRPSSALVLLASLSLTACAGNEIPALGTKKLLDELPRVHNTKGAPCWLQKEIAAQNSYLASIEQKKEVIYSAPCVVDKPAPPAKATS